MSIFNYKAEFLKQEGSQVFYNFYPDYFGYENIKGEFKINLANWEILIISRTQVNDWDSSFCNERPTSALVHKIRKSFEEKGEVPKQVFWNA